MKILMTILATLLLLAGAGLGFTLYTVDNEDQGTSQELFDKIEELKTSAGIENDESTELGDLVKESIGIDLAEIPTPGQFMTAKILAIIVALLCLLALIGYFMNLGQLKLILVALILLAIVSIFMHPANDKGEYGGLSNDVLAMIVGGCSIVGALFAYYGNVLKNKVAA